MCNRRSCCAALSLRSGCVALEDGMPMPAPVSQDALWSQERVVVDTRERRQQRASTEKNQSLLVASETRVRLSVARRHESTDAWSSMKHSSWNPPHPTREGTTLRRPPCAQYSKVTPWALHSKGQLRPAGRSVAA